MKVTWKLHPFITIYPMIMFHPNWLRVKCSNGVQRSRRKRSRMVNNSSFRGLLWKRGGFEIYRNLEVQFIDEDILGIRLKVTVVPVTNILFSFIVFFFNLKNETKCSSCVRRWTESGIWATPNRCGRLMEIKHQWV